MKWVYKIHCFKCLLQDRKGLTLLNSCSLALGRNGFIICIYLHDANYLGKGNGNPLQYSCLENPMDGGAW